MSEHHLNQVVPCIERAVWLSIDALLAFTLKLGRLAGVLQENILTQSQR